MSCPARTVRIGPVAIGGDHALAFIAGPCVIENRDSALRHAAALREAAERSGVSIVFKSSFDKANRTSLESYRGPGLENGLRILEEVRRETGLPVLTDVHEPSQAAAAAEVVDALQIPAFLCRQTDLLVACARTGKPINWKKGQFLAPWDVEPALGKMSSAGNDRILVTERGTSFGYNNLVVDMRSLSILARFGYPVVFDAGHSVQEPGGRGARSGGAREFIRPLSRAAVAVGVDALFVEVHEDPDRALSDGPNSYPLEALDLLFRELKRFDELRRELRRTEAEREGPVAPEAKARDPWRKLNPA